MDLDFPEDIILQTNFKIIRDILKDHYLNVTIKDLVIKENLEQQSSQVSCILQYGVHDKEGFHVKGCGSGPVDALFSSIVNEISGTYVSLHDISFEDFKMSADFKDTFAKSKTDVPVSIRLVVAGGKENKKIYFRAKSRSMISASVQVIREAIEYFINSELAVLQLYRSIQEASLRNRTDLVQDYTFKLAELVDIVSYERTIQQFKDKFNRKNK